MASSGNFSTMNPLHRTSTNVQYSNGNLTFSPNSSWSETTFTRNNMVIPKDKKIYFEVYYKTQSGYYAMHGLSAVNAGPTTAQSGSTGTIIIYNNSTRINGTRTDGVVTAASQGDVIGIAIDGSNNKVWFAVNNTWQISGDPANGTNEIGTITTNDTVGHDITAAFNQNSVSSLTVNFGQDSSFGGDKTSGSASAADGNGFGDFYYTPPTGFLALCSANLSISDDIDPAQTDDDFPQKNFSTTIYTGIGGTSANNVTGVGFQPDFLWIKNREQTGVYSNALVDSTRGRSKVSYSSRSQAEATSSSSRDISAIGSDGFTIQNTSNIDGNQSGIGYVAWCWRANGGTTASNTEGGVNSTTQANTAAGFSIVTYTGIAGASGASTVGHGLSKAPEFIMHVSRTRAAGRWIQHVGTSSSNHILQMGTSQETDYSSYGNIASPTTTTFGINGIDGIGGESANYVAYVWHGVEGYSKFGVYIGNGNSDGPFIYTGFRPALYFVKPIDATNSWRQFDDKRNGFNPDNLSLAWDQAYADDSSYKHDILSNGFKIRDSNNATNQSGITFVYGAWGSTPFKYNNTF